MLEARRLTLIEIEERETRCSEQRRRNDLQHDEHDERRPRRAPPPAFE